MCFSYTKDLRYTYFQINNWLSDSVTQTSRFSVNSSSKIGVIWYFRLVEIKKKFIIIKLISNMCEFTFKKRLRSISIFWKFSLKFFFVSQIDIFIKINYSLVKDNDFIKKFIRDKKNLVSFIIFKSDFKGKQFLFNIQ